MVLAIARPDIEVDLLDSLGKRVTFLDTVASELGLANVHAYHDRAELFAKESGRRGPTTLSQPAPWPACPFK